MFKLHLTGIETKMLNRYRFPAGSSNCTLLELKPKSYEIALYWGEVQIAPYWN